MARNGRTYGKTAAGNPKHGAERGLCLRPSKGDWWYERRYTGHTDEAKCDDSPVETDWDANETDADLETTGLPGLLKGRERDVEAKRRQYQVELLHRERGELLCMLANVEAELNSLCEDFYPSYEYRF